MIIILAFYETDCNKTVQNVSKENINVFLATFDHFKDKICQSDMIAYNFYGIDLILNLIRKIFIVYIGMAHKML